MNRILAAIYAIVAVGIPSVAYLFGLSAHAVGILLAADFLVAFGLAAYLGIAPPLPPVPQAVAGVGRRFGKLAPRTDPRTFLFENYLVTLPPVMARYSALRPGISLPMDGNDQYGDCTIAAKAHLRTIWNPAKVASRATVLRDYFRLGNHQDNGLVMVDVLNDWRKRSFNGEKILAWVKIDHTNHDHVKLAMELFKGVYLGFNVEKDCEPDFMADRPWSPGPELNEGHCVVATEHDMRLLGGPASDLSIATWGKADQPATWAWWDECVDEAYAIVPMEAKKTGFNGVLNIAQLEADLAAL